MVKYIDVKEFRELGFIQEINRQVLHPAGLALEVQIDDETDEVTLGGIWDYREDPEGVLYQPDEISQDKIKSVEKLQQQHDEARIKEIGQRIQQPE